ncbi:MAG: IPT/TIG domain-containing protein [Bacteroidia bacterium]|nr:IPT/TIG domain-containing protein [Bacteroidia bacterium]
MKRFKSRFSGGGLAWVYALLFLGLGVGCDNPSASNPPNISSLSPAAGNSTTIVTINGSRFGTGGKVVWDADTLIPQGTGDPLVFTVPYNAAAGNHSVKVVIQGFSSNSVNFNVTSTVAGPNPNIEGWEVGYFNLGRAAVEDDYELVIYGTGFDNNCVIEVNGTAISNTGLPGVPAGSLLGALKVGSSMQGYPANLYPNGLIARLNQNAGIPVPALGANLNVRVRNTVTNALSNQVAVSIPARRVLVEFDKIDTTIVSWVPVAIFRNNRVNTLRRSYSNAGLLIDSRYDQSVRDLRRGADYTDADLVNLFNSNSSLSGNTFANEWYFHTMLVTTIANPNPGRITLGKMWDTANRSGLAVAMGSFVGNNQGALRTLIHEIGHGFNLSHCEGDATVPAATPAVPCPGPNANGTTIMNQTLALGGAWTYLFSAASTNHLTNHSLNEVQPGAGQMGFNSAARVEGRCCF